MSFVTENGFSLILPAQYDFVGDIVKNPEYRGKVMRIFYAIRNIASIFRPILGGHLYLVLEIHILYVISILFNLLNIFLLFLLKSKKEINTAINKLLMTS